MAMKSKYCGRCGLCGRSTDARKMDVATGRAEAGSWYSSLKVLDGVVIF